MALIKGFFVGHPFRMGAAGVVAIAGLAIAWWLGSPLFIQTYADEALPAATAPAGRAPAVTGAAATGAPAEARILVKGELGFVDSLHNGKGEVRLVDLGGGRRVVRFETVMIQNGPDLHVYLSKDAGGRYVEANAVYLGALKATNGSFNYDVPAGTDVSMFKSIVVWCRAFSTLFTWADLR